MKRFGIFILCFGCTSSQLTISNNSSNEDAEVDDSSTRSDVGNDVGATEDVSPDDGRTADVTIDSDTGVEINDVSFLMSYESGPDPRWTDLPAALSTVEIIPESTLEFAVAEEIQSIRVSFDGTVVEDLERPFRVNDAGSDFVSWDWPVGSHTFEFELFESADLTGEPLVIARTFDVTQLGVDPTPETGSHNRFDFWKTSTDVYVTRNGDGDFVNAAGDVLIDGDLITTETMGDDQTYLRAAGGVTLDFAFIVMLPDGYDPTVAYPLLVFLHHGGIIYRGNDNDGRPMQTPLFQDANSITQSDRRHEFPAIVVVPQLYDKVEIDGVTHEWAAFTSINNTTGNSTSAENVSQNSVPLLQLIDDLLAKNIVINGGNPTVEPARLYLTGHSMGGLGTWDLIAREPDRWAAAVPMSGYPDHAKAEGLVNLPIWAFHHEIDCYNPYAGTQTMFDRITGDFNGTEMELTRLTFDTGGACDQAHFQTPQGGWNDTAGLLPWIFSQVNDRR